MCMMEKKYDEGPFLSSFVVLQLCTQANLDRTPTQSDKYLYG